MTEARTRTAPPPTDEVIHGHHPVEPSEGHLPATTPPAATVAERDEGPGPDLPEQGPGAVIAAISAIMAEAKPIEKAGFNKFHGYAHVRMQDLSAELTPLMGKHGIVIFQDEIGRDLFDNGNVLAIRYRFTVTHKSGAIWPQRPMQTGVSTCRNTKSGFDDKALNKCHTAARKYFLLSLFQLASEDMEDADNEKPPAGQRPKGRPVPSPSGKLSPHTVPVITGEAPSAWVERLLAFVGKAESKVEIDGWYSENQRILERIEQRGDPSYDVALNGFDAREAEILAGKPQEKPAAPADAKAADFPGDTQPAKSGELGDIPEALDRRKTRRAPPPPADGMTDEEREWIEALTNQFTSESDIEGVDMVYDRNLEPFLTKHSVTAVGKARELYDAARDRVEGKS